MLVQSYLFFNGNCAEAIEFYRKAIGAEVEMILPFKDCPDPLPPGTIAPGWGEKVMHASFKVGETQLMASDGMCADGTKGFSGFSLSITARDEAHADRLFTALAEGGKVQMPLGKTFFSPCFGQVADRFGVAWMVIVVPPA